MAKLEHYTIKKAKIISAEKNVNARIVCPYCEARLVTECKSMDSAWNEECEKCGRVYEINIPDLISKIHWAYKWPNDKDK